MNWVIALLWIAALATSTLSGIIGMGGGILFLAVLFAFLPHAEAIPVHGLVQIASNSTRVLVFAKSVDRRALARFFIGLIPGSALGLVFLSFLRSLEGSEPYLKMAVGAYVLVAPFIPKRRSGQTTESAGGVFPLIGLLAGFMALSVGAVGPLIAPVFARLDFVKERLIATKAACQMLTHLLKIPAFIWLGSLNVDDVWRLALPLMIAVIPGTLLGKRLLRHVSPDAFRWMYRAALVVAGLKVLLVDGIYAAFR